ncbi:hypothetical protein DFQ28_000350, partial [Apophysomyces sp. BC1034]
FLLQTRMNLTGGKILKHLIAKNGPMTTKALAQQAPMYPEKLVSARHLKQRILPSLERNGVLMKKVHNDPESSKPVWTWRFTKEEHAEKYKHINVTV